MLVNLFKAETLDTRFVPSAAAAARNRQRSNPSRWLTREFAFYWVIHLIFVPLMCITAASAGSSQSPTYALFKHKLSPGWLGPTVDASDPQYGTFRSQIPLLAAIGLVHVLLRMLVKCKVGDRRTTFDLIFGLIMVSGMHGLGVLKMLAILWVNFELARRTRSRALCWVFAIGVLLANELLQSHFMLPSLGCPLPQWEIYFKCTMMRMLGYNLDYIEATSVPQVDSEKHSESAEMDRIITPRPMREYCFSNYLAFCLYAPLYLAGPLLTFNDFRVQCERKLPSINRKSLSAYFVRFLACLLCMEFVLHYIPVVAIADTRAWKNLSPAQVSMVGFFNLVVIWLKLLLPWRFFRLWSLVDGIDSPENMVRCVSNNYSAMSFWRSWHRSFHRWVIRYLYVPLGGSKHQLRNALIVFAYVALWHDIQLRLFVWGFLIVLFVVPEAVGRVLVPFKKYGQRWWYRYVAGVGAVLNIWMMLIANLVGFAVGVDGIQALLGEMMHTAAGLRFTVLCSLLLFVGVQVMFEHRESELRRGIDLKC